MTDGVRPGVCTATLLWRPSDYVPSGFRGWSMGEYCHQADLSLGDLLSATMLNSPCKAGSPPQCIPLTFIHDLKEIGKRRTS